MRSLLVSALAAIVCLSLAAAAPSLAAEAKKSPGPARKPPASMTKTPPTRPSPPDPAAVDALIKMSIYLQSLKSFEMSSETSLDLVAEDGQKLQLDGTARYRVRKPDAFVVDVVSDTWNRNYYYNGKDFTLYAPKQNLFSTWQSPSNIQAALKDANDRFGISLPLEDLFRWFGDDGTRADRLESGFFVDTATIDGAKTDHYAFREGMIDWQVWIEQGDKPLPRKLMIVDRRDPAAPAYIARLKWNLDPPLADDIFTFRPAPDAKRIRTILQQ
jgi:hypothetical protein